LATGLLPDPLGELKRSPDRLAAMRAYFYGEGRGGKGGKGRGRRGRMRREGEGQRGKAGRGKEGLAWVRKKFWLRPCTVRYSVA